MKRRKLLYTDNRTDTYDVLHLQYDKEYDTYKLSDGFESIRIGENDVESMEEIVAILKKQYPAYYIK